MDGREIKYFIWEKKRITNYPSIHFFRNWIIGVKEQKNKKANNVINTYIHTHIQNRYTYSYLHTNTCFENAEKYAEQNYCCSNLIINTAHIHHFFPLHQNKTPKSMPSNVCKYDSLLF